MGQGAAVAERDARAGLVTLLALAVSGRGLVEPDEPAVFADDEAVLRGRAAFETLRVYDGRPFRLDAHLDRLTSSAARIGIAEPDRTECAHLAELALGHADELECVLRFYRTPGREGAREPSVLVLVSSLPTHLEELRERGIALTSLLGIRAEAPWLLGGVKSTSYAVNMAAEAEARRRGADDALFVDGDGNVLEGPVTNLWWRRDTTLYTPSLDLGILAGVTRDTLLELAPASGYTVEEGRFSLADVRAAEEVFTSSSVRELMPVVALDGEPIPRGEAAAALQAALRRAALR
ncbi:MAG: aminotransferase class IV [Gaiellaceae bacterium]